MKNVVYVTRVHLYSVQRTTCNLQMMKSGGGHGNHAGAVKDVYNEGRCQVC